MEKACGIDQIHAEMLKADLDTSTKILTTFFCFVWDSNVIPEDWTKGLIVTLPKKATFSSAITGKESHCCQFHPKSIVVSFWED